MNNLQKIKANKFVVNEMKRSKDLWGFTPEIKQGLFLLSIISEHYNIHHHAMDDCDICDLYRNSSVGVGIKI